MAKIAIVTPWRTRCGIAEYSAKLVKELAKIGTHLKILKTKTGCKNPIFFKKLADETRKFDLINVQYQLGLYGEKGVYVPLFFNLLPRKKVITTVHEIMAIPPNTTSGKIALHYGNFLMKNVIQNSEALIVHNKYTQKLISENFDIKKVHYMPFGAKIRKCVQKNKARRKLGIKQEKVLLTFGFLIPNKRFELIIEALEEIDNTFLIIAGEDRDKKYSEKLKEFAEDIGVQKRVKFTGFVPDDKLPLIFGAADIVIFPYLYCETSGAVHTALGFGKPVITSRIPAFEEFNYIQKFKDKSDLVDKIKHYLSSQEERNKLERKQREFTEQIRWSNIARKIKGIYQGYL